MMSHVTVTNYHITLSLSHNHMSQWKIIEDFRSNNVITMCLTHIDLKDNTWPLR